METKIQITNTIDGRILVQAPAADKFWMAQLLSAGERKFLTRSDKHDGFVVMHGVFQIGADDEKMFIVVKFDYKQRKFVHRVVDGDLNQVNRKCFDLKQEALRGYCVPRYKGNIDVLWNNRTTNEFLPPTGGGIGVFGHALKYLIEGGELEVLETTLECVVDALYWFKDVIAASFFHKKDTYVAVFYNDNSGEEYEEYSFKDTELVCKIAKLIDEARDEFGEPDEQVDLTGADKILGAPVSKGVETQEQTQNKQETMTKTKSQTDNKFVLGKGMYYFERNGRWFVLSTKGAIYVLDVKPEAGCKLKDVQAAAKKIIVSGAELAIDDRYVVAGVLRALHEYMPANWFTRVAHKFGFYSYIERITVDTYSSFLATIQQSTAVFHERRRFSRRDKTTKRKVGYIEYRVIDIKV
ncbi:MAG: hypothetical protein KatS3mg087_1908 [Patescibacteria group bacterium]|nr:MAG: hypothetical protein KatS3mg087_1908 [Patescibacteria group bacterium]